MLKCNYAYKHLKIKIGPLEMVVELSIDNMLGSKIYAAKTNMLFLDENESWGHACGVGDTEKKAVDMCLGEISKYLSNINDDSLNITEINIPKRITFEYKKQPVVLYFNELANKKIILTRFGQYELGQNDEVLDYISKNIKSLSKGDISNMSNDYYVENGFCPIFNNLSSKYISDNNCNL